MSRYQPVPNSTSPTRPSFASARPSISSMRFGSSRQSRSHARISDEDERRDEMDAAFDAPDDDEEEEEGGESRGLLGRKDRSRSEDMDAGHGRIQLTDDASARPGTMPGDYDFERDYTLPPSSSPPEYTFPHNASNPAEGNTNGQLPISVARPPANRHFLGGILPTAFLPRRAGPQPGARVLGAGNSGIFSNLAARPEGAVQADGQEGAEWIPETEQKDGPPSYQAALRDAVPPYWDTTVVLPSSNSPWGPLHSSISGDEILIDGMPTGNLFGFLWNLVVSFTFQFVGFLLTYILHTTHSAKYGSRIGLGCTLIQFGLTLRTRAEELISSGEFPNTSSSSNDPSAQTPEEIAADNALEAYYGPGSPWPATIRDPLLPSDAPPVVLHNIHEAELYAERHNQTLNEFLHLPSAEEIGRANEWFSFMLMSIGWFIVITSLGGWWRVKRFENGLKRAQRESEQAQAEANGTATQTEEGASGETTGTGTGTGDASPREWRYYTGAFREWAAGARDIQRGFFGMRGRRADGEGGSRSRSGDGGDEDELLQAQGYMLEPMARGDDESRGEEAQRRGRGLWG